MSIDENTQMTLSQSSVRIIACVRRGLQVLIAVTAVSEQLGQERNRDVESVGGQYCYNLPCYGGVRDIVEFLFYGVHNRRSIIYPYHRTLKSWEIM